MTQSAQHPGVWIERDKALAIIRLDRPDKKNAITSDMYEAMSDALEDAGGSDDIAAMVFLGASGVFTAGNDIGDFLRMTERRDGADDQVLRFLRALAQCRLPILAGVDGLAVGIGTTLLLHCDLVIAGETATFRTPFVDLGIVPEAGSSLIAPRMMGHRWAFELLVAGAPFDARRAYEAGIVNRIVAPEAVERETLAAAQAIAAKPREAVRLSRNLLRGDVEPILERIDAEVRLFSQRLASPEARAAFASFVSGKR